MQNTSDKEITEESTGIAEKTDSHGRPINSDSEYTYQPKESDSTNVTYTILFDDEKGNTYQDYKVHKNTRQGRPISNQYKKIKK